MVEGAGMRLVIKLGGVDAPLVEVDVAKVVVDGCGQAFGLDRLKDGRWRLCTTPDVYEKLIDFEQRGERELI